MAYWLKGFLGVLWEFLRLYNVNFYFFYIFIDRDAHFCGFWSYFVLKWRFWDWMHLQLSSIKLQSHLNLKISLNLNFFREKFIQSFLWHSSWILIHMSSSSSSRQFTRVTFSFPVFFFSNLIKPIPKKKFFSNQRHMEMPHATSIYFQCTQI